MLRSSHARRSTSELHLTGFELSEPRRERHASVIAVAGELDIATAPRLQAGLIDALKDREHETVVDMSRVTFIDSTALRVLVDAQRSRQSSVPLVIVCDHLNVLRIFKIAAFEGAFKIFSTLEKALAYVGEGVTHGSEPELEA